MRPDREVLEDPLAALAAARRTKSGMSMTSARKKLTSVRITGLVDQKRRSFLHQVPRANIMRRPGREMKQCR